MIPRVADRRIVTYGFSAAGRRARASTSSSIRGGAASTSIITDARRDDSRTIERRAPADARRSTMSRTRSPRSPSRSEMGIDDDTIRSGLAGFGGVKRRFTKIGEVDGVTVIDDYGHHPVEIAAVLRAAREATPAGRVIAVVQPHRYTRLANRVRGLLHLLQRCRHGARRRRLCRRRGADRGRQPRRAGRGLARARPSPRAGAAGRRRARRRMVDSSARPGDLVVCLGAGNITNWAHALPGELAAARCRAGAAAREPMMMAA